MHINETEIRFSAKKDILGRYRGGGGDHICIYVCMYMAYMYMWDSRRIWAFVLSSM